MTALPIDTVIPELRRAVREVGRCVLMAPPGAGKTTRVPLALLEDIDGKILMLEPRRLAARGAAERMAQSLGEAAGETVGYRMRGASKISKTTRIEVVTEGILTRMVQSDPELTGIGAVIFDEFHERSLNADLGLALTWEVKGALREDLKIIVMSATLDADPIAALLDDAPIVRSEGRAYPVETRWLERPLPKSTRFETAVADLIHKALREETGSALVFLPGEGEIRRVAQLLKLPEDCALHMLYGAMPFDAQRAAIAPTKTGRKVVLATAIAETSLTIEDVRIVIDAGRARRARFDPSTRTSRLVTEKVTKAEAEQRRGRAGRVQEGVCYRLWTKAEEGALMGFAPAEIETADLSGFALELAQWGSAPEDLALLTQPPEAQFSIARNLLITLGALTNEGRLTDHGRALASTPLHPRMAHMLEVAGAQAADVAALLNERDPLRDAGADMLKRIDALKTPPPFARGAIERIKSEAKRLRQDRPKSPRLSLGEMTALAYPDRIGLRRKGDDARYVLSDGSGAVMENTDPLAMAQMIVVTNTDGAPKDARIRQAAQITMSELRALYGDQITWRTSCVWSKRDGKVEARRQEVFGALVLSDQIWKDAPEEALAAAALEGVRQLGLPWSERAKRLAARLKLAGLMDVSDAALLDSLETWLLPYLGGAKTTAQLRALDITEALKARLSWEDQQRLDASVPPHFESPLGRKIPIDYDGEHPSITARLQELFGVTTHPTVGTTPLRVILTSPAHRPVQTTMDLPGFWASSYADVRKDMRGRYPKHPWPEDPTQADPTLRVKRRS